VNDRQQTYYDLLGVHASASAIEIRRAYRELSKKYHPDTTILATAIATVKFQALNEAYATLSHPERRSVYDLEIGYSRVFVVQSPPNFQPLKPRSDNYRSSAYLDPTDRPLSGGEIFALFMLGVTFIGCLVLAISIAIVRGESS
jgi:curved DNA-binding protein CbpA